MAQIGRTNFSSAFGMKQRKTDRFNMMRNACYECHNNPNIWITWWLADITIVNNTKTLTDSLGGSSGSTNQIFIMSE